jgi:hypothetical protein
MGFGTETQMGNRTSLSDIFRNNIGSPQPAGTTQAPNQLFTLLQSIMGGQGGGPKQGLPGQTPDFDPNGGFGGGGFGGGGGFDGGFGGQGGFGGPNQNPMGGIKLPPGQTPPFNPNGGGGTALSGITAMLPQMGGGTGTSLSNPFANLINQRSVR